MLLTNIRRAQIAKNLRSSTMLVGVACVMAASTAMAQTVAAPAPSTNATVNLIRLLVKQHVITKAAGAALLAEAEAEAAKARADSEKTQVAATAPAPEPVAPEPPAPGTLRVPYVPQIVKDQIRDDLKKEVVAQAKAEGWVSPNKVPEWVNRITLNGDFRFRTDFNFYSQGNSPEIVDFEAFNASGPTDINLNTNTAGVPVLSTNVDRLNRFRIRARLGLTAAVADGVKVGVRLATGDDNSPISTNALLGGGLTKKNIWLDQAYLSLQPLPWTKATFGRMPNPFNTTDLLFDEDLNFDGVAAALDSTKLFDRDLNAGVTLGAFPLEFGSNNFPSTNSTKQTVPSKWLFAAQGKVNFSFADRYTLKLSGGYFYFKNVQGQLSSPCATYSGIKQCDTDFTRPAVLKKGNTVFAIRNIATNPASPFNTSQPQFVGLVYNYHVLNGNAEFTAKVTDTLGASLQGDYVRNLAYDGLTSACRNLPNGLPLNNINFGSDNATTNPCISTTNKATLNGGNTGWQVKGTFGYAKPAKFGEWNVELSYRHLESDAVLDSLTDSDFHLGGTNNKGYVVGATLGLFNNVVMTGRWLSANQIAGDPLAIDVFQLDLKAGF